MSGFSMLGGRAASALAILVPTESHCKSQWKWKLQLETVEFKRKKWRKQVKWKQNWEQNKNRVDLCRWS